MKVENIEKMITESRNENTMNIDSVSTLEIMKLINAEDKKVPYAVENELEYIAKAVDITSKRLSKGGRLIYAGAGTSGRIGILDASECPPTFGVSNNLVQGLIAGGNTAIFKAIEGAEDSEELGKKDLIHKNLEKNDVVCGIAASGRTPYVIGAMKYAKEIGAAVLCITANKKSEMASIADVPIAVTVGPEVIMGSTRMKAGTAQKLIANMISTGTMIKLGKVYSNLMVDVQASNEKLCARAIRIVMLATEKDEENCKLVLEDTNYNVKLSILMIISGLNKNDAEKLLKENKGYIKKSLNKVHNLKIC